MSLRSLEELLWAVIASREDGLVVMRDRDGLRHGVWVQRGFVVGIHVAGRFDPLLDALRQQGRLDEHSYRACVASLTETGGRSGSIAVELAGLPRPEVREALKRQSRERMEALLEIAQSRGHDAAFEPGAVPAAEVAIRMPLGALLPRAETPASPRAPDRAAARRKLRALARRLHPDLHGHLDPARRRQLEQDLAAATAAYHGLTG